MNGRESAALDRFITGNYGEDFFTDVCPTCDGEREVEQRHPMWGNINCPEPTILARCPDCMGVDPDGDAR